MVDSERQESIHLIQMLWKCLKAALVTVAPAVAAQVMVAPTEAAQMMVTSTFMTLVMVAPAVAAQAITVAALVTLVLMSVEMVVELGALVSRTDTPTHTHTHTHTQTCIHIFNVRTKYYCDVLLCTSTYMYYMHTSTCIHIQTHTYMHTYFFIQEMIWMSLVVIDVILVTHFVTPVSAYLVVLMKTRYLR